MSGRSVSTNAIFIAVFQSEAAAEETVAPSVPLSMRTQNGKDRHQSLRSALFSRFSFVRIRVLRL